MAAGTRLGGRPWSAAAEQQLQARCGAAPDRHTRCAHLLGPLAVEHVLQRREGRACGSKVGRTGSTQSSSGGDGATVWHACL